MTEPINIDLLRMNAQGACDEASSRSTNARNMMEAFLQDTQSILGMIGGILQGVMGVLGKGGGGGGKGGKGGKGR